MTIKFTLRLGSNDSGLPANSIARTEVGDVVVSTVSLFGISHGEDSLGRPLIYETTVFGGDLDGSQWHYATVEEACLGHGEVVAAVRGQTT